MARRHKRIPVCVWRKARAMSFDPTRPPAVLPSDIDIDAATAFLWNPQSLRFVWASPAGARFWSAQGASRLAERSHAPDEPTARELERLWLMAESLVAPGVRRRFETTAVFWPEGAAKPVRCAAQRVMLSNGDGALLVEILGDDPRAAASRWRDIFLETPAPLAIFDGDGLLLDQNMEAARIFPDDAGDALDDRFVDADEARRAMQLALANGAYSQTVQLMLREGPQPRRLRLARIAAPEDGAPSVLSLALDPVHENDASLATSALDGADFGLAVIDISGADATLVLANPAFTALLDDIEPSSANLSGARSTTRPQQLPAALISAIGPIAEILENETSSEPRAVDVIAPSSDSDSTVPGPWLKATVKRLGAGRFAISLADLGPERRALLRLKIANEQTAAALDALGVGLGAIDPAGKLIALSPTAAKLVGSDADAMIGQSLETLLPRTDSRRLLDYLAQGPVVAGRALEGGIETSIRASEPPSSEEDALPVRLGLAPRSRLSPARRRFAFHRRAAAEAGARGKLGSGAQERAVELAHALRTRLTSVQGFAELLVEETGEPLNTLADAYLADIIAAAQECVTLVDQHLTPRDVAPEKAAAPHPESGPQTGAALAPLLRSAVMRRDDLLGRKGAERSSLETGAAQTVRVAARPAQVRELLDRLLAAIEADAAPGRTSLTLSMPKTGLALVSAEAAGAPISSRDLPFRLLADDVETLHATIETDPTARRIMVLFKTV